MTEPIVIAVGGGKGGVGKSVVAANVAVAAAGMGMRTVLVDADLGAANQHTLFGIDRPRRTLQALLDRDASSLEEIVESTGVPRLFLVPGVGAIPGAANLAHSQKLKLVRHLGRIDCDVLVVDVGAGVGFNVLDFFALGDHRLIVTTPQLSAMQNAYCFAKASVHRQLRRRIENHAQREAFGHATQNSETERLSELRRRARAYDAGMDAAFDQVARGFGAKLVGNMMESDGQRRVLTALSRMCRDFLDIDVPVAATLSMSRAIHESVTRRRPIALGQPTHPAVRATRRMVEELLSEDIGALRRARLASPPSIRPAAAAPEGPAPLVGYLREDHRVEVRHAARVGADAIPARVRDVSASGMRIEGPLDALEGDRLGVTLVGFEDRPTFYGVVRHVSACGGRFGLEADAGAENLMSRLLDPASPRATSTLPPPMAAVG